MQSSWPILGILLVLEGFLQLVVTQEYCGQKEPDAEKLCVSLRLPWQPEPVYFCTEKDKINYRKKCKGSTQYCPPQSDDTLQISTPWDCCPLTSQPDPCANAKCPPAPFNRTCSEYFTDNFWECCPHYYCEQGDREMCQIKKLEPGCMSHPKDKLNCTAFIDPHGCCNKYQCPEDEKPGQCPSSLRQQTVGLLPTTTMTSVSNSNSSSKRVASHYYGSMAPVSTYSVVSFGSLQQCTSDYTCENKKKCCPLANYPSTVRFGGGGGEPGTNNVDRRVISGPPTSPFGGKISSGHQNFVVHGYCMEPMNDGKDHN